LCIAQELALQKKHGTKQKTIHADRIISLVTYRHMQWSFDSLIAVDTSSITFKTKTFSKTGSDTLCDENMIRTYIKFDRDTVITLTPDKIKWLFYSPFMNKKKGEKIRNFVWASVVYTWGGGVISAMVLELAGIPLLPLILGYTAVGAEISGIFFYIAAHPRKFNLKEKWTIREVQ